MCISGGHFYLVQKRWDLPHVNSSCLEGMVAGQKEALGCYPELHWYQEILIWLVHFGLIAVRSPYCCSPKTSAVLERKFPKLHDCCAKAHRCLWTPLPCTTTMKMGGGGVFCLSKSKPQELSDLGVVSQTPSFRSCSLFALSCLLLRVVLPDTDGQAGCHGQPAQVGQHQQRCHLVDAVPGAHGADGQAVQAQDVDQRLQSRQKNIIVVLPLGNTQQDKKPSCYRSWQDGPGWDGPQG